MAKLGINIDHVATLRQARREMQPDPVLAAAMCEQAGAHSIIAHLREDRRHMNDKDIRRLRKSVQTRFNLEMSVNDEIVDIALALKPDQATLVPERRQEITTEGGLNVVGNFSRLRKVTQLLLQRNIVVSLFIDPSCEQIDRIKELGVDMIEFHTGRYSRAKTQRGLNQELKQLIEMTRYATDRGLIVNAGHGLNYENARAVSRIPGIEELNIGHSIISRAVFVGLENAVKEMMALVS